MPPGGERLHRYDARIRKLRSSGSREFCLIGVDEAGRGPLAGPVVACAAVLPRTFRDRRIDDSKKLTPRRRNVLYDHLRPRVRWAFGLGTVDLIDERNILQATHHAMKLAVANLLRRYPGLSPDLILVDGRPVPDLGFPQKAVPGADGKSASVAAASILAKVFRDRIMTALERSYPQYGLARHKGYPTREHKRRLARFGPAKIHRKSFSPVSALLQRVRA